jgi:hypothetical protein
VSPESLKLVPLGVAICAKLEQAAPWHRSTLYPVTPTLSVEAVQLKSICVLDAAVAVRPLGAAGGVASGGSGGCCEEPEPLQPLNPRTTGKRSNATNGHICAECARDGIPSPPFPDELRVIRIALSVAGNYSLETDCFNPKIDAKPETALERSCIEGAK